MEDKWQKVREIFDSALRCKPEERPQFVAEACGEDQVLLAEVKSLLLSLDNSESFMETPAVAKVADVIEPETAKLENGRCFGHYEIIKQIGAGGMGEVYLARDKKLDRNVAVKILNERFSSEESNLNRFIQEAKAASALDHPNILVIHEIGDSDGKHYIISEYIKGKTLREFLKERTLNLSEILDISIQIANALTAAHEVNLVHRDIKPENIIIRPDGYVKVLDFGLAKLIERKNKSILGLEDSTVQHNQTAKGVIMGTVNYMSPEQAKGERVDERTDIFSFGVLLYEMIAGKTPFAGDSMSETFANLINAEPPALSPFAVNLPNKFQRIVSKMIRKDKDERYQTAQELAVDLKVVRQDLEIENKLGFSTIHDTKSNTLQVLEIVTNPLAEQSETKIYAQAAIKQDAGNQSKTTKHQKGLRPGLKSLLWGLGIGFGFLILFNILLILGTGFFTNQNNTPPHIKDMLGNLRMLTIPVGLGFFFGIWLFLFGIIRLIYTLFEKETSKLKSSLIEKLIAVVITGFIAAVAIPNLIFSYRQANENRQSEINNSRHNQIKSIAVLPLKAINQANRNEIYEIGIADSLIQRLGSIKDFVVRPLSAIRKYVNVEQDPLAAGREQQVNYVLASNYQIAGGKIRVTSQLLNVENGQIEETYKTEKDASDVFAMQDAVSEDVGNLLQARFNVVRTRQTEKRETDNEEAYRLYLQGMYFYDKRTKPDAYKAVEVLEQAVRLDPNYAWAWAGLAHAHRYLANLDINSNLHEESRKSMEAVDKALALNNNVSEAYSALCDNKLNYEYDFAGAETACQRAIELKPDSTVARNIYARFLMSRGRFDEAIAEIKTAIDLEPTSYFHQIVYTICLVYARRYDEAFRQMDRLAELNPGNAFKLYWGNNGALMTQENPSQAFERTMKYLKFANADEQTLQLYQTTYQTARWQGVMRGQISKISENPQEHIFFAAAINAQLGNKDKAMEFLEKSYQRREFWMAYLQVEPRLDSLRGDPRFESLVKRVESK